MKIENLVQDSNSFTKYCFIESFTNDTEILRSDILQMFKNFDRFNSTPLLRIYVDKGHRYDVLRKFIKDIPSCESNISTFESDIKKSIGESNFCITFNGLTAWNKDFHERIYKSFVDPMIKRVGKPIAGIDFYSFIGNYGFTPFGFHDDDDHSILIHLGPSEKKLWIIERDDYYKITGHHDPSFDFELLTNHGKELTLKPGDLAFIPHGDFHVFKSDSFSLTLGITIFPENEASLTKRAVESSLGKLKTSKEAYFGEQDMSGVEKLVRDSEYEFFVIKNELEANGFVTTKSKTPKEKNLFSKLDMSKEMSVSSVLPVFLKSYNDRIHLFSREITIDFQYSSNLERILSYIISEKFSINKIVETFSESIEYEALERVLKMLLENDILRYVK